MTTQTLPSLLITKKQQGILFPCYLAFMNKSKLFLGVGVRWWNHSSVPDLSIKRATLTSVVSELSPLWSFQLSRTLVLEVVTGIFSRQIESFLFVKFRKGKKKKKESKLTKSPYCGLWVEIFLANENTNHRKHWVEGIAFISWPGSYWVLKCKELRGAFGHCILLQLNPRKMLS